MTRNFRVAPISVGWLTLAALLPTAALTAAPLPVVTPADKIQQPRPRNIGRDRKLESTITAVKSVDDKLTVTLKAGAMTVALNPATEVVEEERGLFASDLKENDGICLVTFKSNWTGKIVGKAVVTSTAPLSLKLEDLGTTIFTKVEGITFSRYRPILADTLAVGQTVAVAIHAGSDGEIETKRVAVLISTKATVKKTRKAPAGRKAAG